jgi:hypothetical protein
VLPALSKKLEKPMERAWHQRESKNYTAQQKVKWIRLYLSWIETGNRNTRFKNVEYESDDLNAREQDDIEFVEDDCHSFIINLHVGYFWDLAEVTHLTNHISQNCSAISMNANSKHSSTSTRGYHTNKKGKAKRQKMEKQSASKQILNIFFVLIFHIVKRRQRIGVSV